MKFLKHSLHAAGALVTVPLFAGTRLFRNNPSHAQAETGGSEPAPALFAQAPLPYPYDALEPHIDARTMELHFTKHHAKYVKEVADAIAEEKITANNAEDFFAKVSSYSAKARNNGGGAWNHDLYWRVMRPASAHCPAA